MMGKEVYEEKLDKDFEVTNLINRVDYLQKWDSKMSSFDVELSFTVLDWLITDKIIFDKNFSVADVETEQRIQLCFNIWPQGNGILHLLARQGKFGKHEQQTGDFIQAIYSAQQLFEVCQDANDFGLMGTSYYPDGVTLEVPILPNIYGYTCVDYCLPGGVPDRHIDSQIFQSDPLQAKILT